MAGGLWLAGGGRKDQLTRANSVGILVENWLVSELWEFVFAEITLQNRDHSVWLSEKSVFVLVPFLVKIIHLKILQR